MKIKTQPVLFISHGGGPWPYIEDMRPHFARTTYGLRKLANELPQVPSAVIIVSGHWQTPGFQVSSSDHPAMEYDYSGFPEHTYHISYPAPGSPELAQKIIDTLALKNLSCQANPERGLDHGIFVPMVIMFPEANIPIVSLSIRSSFNAAEHLVLGDALSCLRHENVLIIGSGLSYHNLRQFGSTEAGIVSKTFEDWLFTTLTHPDKTIRNHRLIKWEQAPEARKAHPREDHLIPLMVIAGAAGDEPGERVILDEVWNVTMSSYRFG
ncbi:MAG: dioxygenase [Pseudomonadota bacterium]|nr:dioxygenase [Pseudomonadota bacterium]